LSFPDEPSRAQEKLKPQCNVVSQQGHC
jgi:hypothetical protein